MNKIQIILNNHAIEEAHANYIKTSGSFNYYPTVTITGSASCINSAISVACHSKINREVLIAAKFTWSRTQSNRSEPVQNSSNYYHCCPKDRNYYIECVITPVEEGFDGECKIVYGPMSLDTQTETQFQLAKKEERYRVTAEGFYENSKNALRMIELTSNTLRALDHNLKPIGEIEVGSKTFIIPAQNDPTKLKIFNAGGPEISLQTQNILQRDVIMLLLEHKKNKTNELTNILPLSFNDGNSFEGAQSIPKWQKIPNKSPSRDEKQSSNVFSNIQQVDRHRKVFTDNIDFDLNKKSSNWPSMKESAFNFNDNNMGRHNENTQRQVQTYDDIKLQHSNDSYVSGQLPSKGNKNMTKSNQKNPLHQKFTFQSDHGVHDEKQSLFRNNLESVNLSPVSKKEAAKLKRFPTETPWKSEVPLNDQKASNIRDNKAKAVGNLIKETKLEEVMKQYLENNSNFPPEADRLAKYPPETKSMNSEFFKNEDNKDVYISRLNTQPPNNQTSVVDDNRLPNFNKGQQQSNNTYKKARSELNDLKNSMISFQPPKDQLSFNKAKTIRNQLNNIELITEGDLQKNTSAIGSKKNEGDIYARIDDAIYTDYQKLKETYETEKAKMSNEVSKLKIANKSLLREVEYLQGERVRIEDEAQVELNDKELQLLEEQTRLRETIKSMKKYIEQIENDFSIKSQIHESTSTKIFELENQNFEMRFSNNQKEEIIEKMDEQNIFLNKKIEYTEDQLSKTKDDLSSAEEKVRKSNMSLLQLEITQRTCKELKEENEQFRSLFDDHRVEADKNDLLIQNLYGNLNEKEEEIHRLSEAVLELKEKILSKERETEIKLKINNDQKAKRALQDQYEDLLKNYENAERENYHLKDNHDLAEEENTRLRNTIKELRDQVSKKDTFGRLVEQEKDRLLNDECDSLRRELKRIDEENSVLVKDLDYYKNEIAILKRTKEDLQYSNEANLDKIFILQTQIEQRAKMESSTKPALTSSYPNNTNPVTKSDLKETGDQPNLEETNKRLRLKVATLISELRNERIKRKEAEIGVYRSNEQSQDFHSQTYRADTLNESRNMNDKLAQLQKDYVISIQENEKLRNDLYNVREEKFAIIEKYGQRKSMSIDNMGQEEFMQLLTPNEEDHKNKKAKEVRKLNDFDPRALESVQDFYKRIGKSNTNDFNDEDKDKVIRHLEAKVNELQNKLLDTHFGLDQAPNHIEAKGGLFEKTKTLLSKQAEITIDYDKIKSILVSLIAKFNEKPSERYESMSLDRLLEELKSVMGEVDGLKVEYLHMNKFVDEANQMIGKYELQKKELASRIEELMEEKEILLESLQK
jgi:hypothetical protein